MEDIEMLNLLKELDIGNKIIVGIKCFDGAIAEVEGTYEGGLEQYGYYSVGGGWGLYSIKEYIPELIEVPCYKFLFKPKRKRKLNVLKIGFDIGTIKMNIDN